MRGPGQSIPSKIGTRSEKRREYKQLESPRCLSSIRRIRREQSSQQSPKPVPRSSYTKHAIRFVCVAGARWSITLISQFLQGYERTKYSTHRTSREEMRRTHLYPTPSVLQLYHQSRTWSIALVLQSKCGALAASTLLFGPLWHHWLAPRLPELSFPSAR